MHGLKDAVTFAHAGCLTEKRASGQFTSSEHFQNHESVPGSPPPPSLLRPLAEYEAAIGGTSDGAGKEGNRLDPMLA